MHRRALFVALILLGCGAVGFQAASALPESEEGLGRRGRRPKGTPPLETPQRGGREARGDSSRAGKPAGRPNIKVKAGEGNPWQRVTHEACVHILAEGKSCQELESKVRPAVQSNLAPPISVLNW